MHTTHLCRIARTRFLRGLYHTTRVRVRICRRGADARRVRYLRFACVAAILAALAGLPDAPATAQSAMPLSIVVKQAEPAPVAALGDPLHEQLFILVDLNYGGTDPLQLSYSSFHLADATGVAHSAEFYDGGLGSMELESGAHATGRLLFTIATGKATNLLLRYEPTVYDQFGHSRIGVLGQAGPFTPRPSLKRLYAIAAQQPLGTYLVDEALAAADVRSNLDPLYSSGDNAAVPAATRVRLRRERALLMRDQRRFDAVRASGADAQGYKRQADLVFTAIEADLDAAVRLRRFAEWTAWRAAFSQDDRALADLYQSWPGLSIAPPPTNGS